LAIGCGGDGKSKDSAKPKAAESETGYVEEPLPPAVWEGVYECKRGDRECRDDRNFGEGIYFSGTVFNTVVNRDVNARTEPSSAGGNATVIGQIRKDTRVQVLGITRDWAFVTTREVVSRRGWVSSSFLDYREGQRLTVTEMRITDFNLTARDSSTADLKAVYSVGGVEKTMEFRAFKLPGQPFFSFFYDIYVPNSHYTIPPGLYVWRFARNQLNHTVPKMRSPIAHGDASIIWEKAVFSDDLKFYFVTENDKTLVFRANGRPLLSEVAVESFNQRAKTIMAVCPADNVMARCFQEIEEMDTEIERYADEYAEANRRPESHLSLHVLCEINLESGARRITKGEWR
jgi:hypothetical protein